MWFSGVNDRCRDFKKMFDVNFFNFCKKMGRTRDRPRGRQRRHVIILSKNKILIYCPVPFNCSFAVRKIEIRLIQMVYFEFVIIFVLEIKSTNAFKNVENYFDLENVSDLAI